VASENGRRRYLVTGANSGIGEHTARALAAQDAHVLLLCRDAEDGERARREIAEATGNPHVDLVLCDLSSQEQIRSAASGLRAEHDELHVLVNNAGIVLDERSTTAQRNEVQFAVNHLAPFLLTHELQPLLEEADDARVVTVASEAHRSAGSLPEDFQNLEGSYSGFKVYAQTKLYNILFTLRLAEVLDPVNVAANCLHPGVVGTGWGEEGPWYVRWFMKLARPFLRDPAEGASTSVYLAASGEARGVTGTYFQDREPAEPADRVHDEALQTELWATSEQLTGATDWPATAQPR
jgi:NAD(P)-dependent dehydrogenase (short-subunit alcohol dehydrogenase family)